MEAPRSMQQQTLQKSCQYIEDGKPCGLPLSGTARKYCTLHREDGQIQAKRQRDRDDKALYRKHCQLEDNYYQFLYYHRLTEPQLKPLVERAKSLQEQYPSSMDDFHQSALDELNEIKRTMLNPPPDLLSTAKAAKQQTLPLLTRLTRRQDDSFNPVTDRLIAYAQELQRDIGKRVSSRAFTEISGEAKEVLNIWRQQKEIRGFIYALFVMVELNRLKFLAMPDEHRYLNMAHRWLTATADVCDQAISHCTGMHKQTASLLAFCVPLLKTVLAFNGGEPESAESSIQSLQDKTNAFADSYGTTPGTDSLRYTWLVHQTQLDLYFNKIDRAYKYIDEAEAITSTMQGHSLESQLEIAYAKASLALASKDRDRYKDLHEYILLFQRHPFLTHYSNLQALKKLYGKDVDESLFTGVPIYFDTMFRRLQPFWIHV
jgi:hypothetical protein